MIRKTIKVLSLLLVCAIALLVIYNPFSATSEIERRVKSSLEDAGLTHVDVKVDRFNSSEITFSKVAFDKEEVKVEIQNLYMDMNDLPLGDIARGNYNKIKGKWQIEALNVAGTAYPFPPLAGTGEFAFVDNKPEVKGVLESKDKQVAGDFTVNTSSLKMKRVQLPWEGARISAKDVDYSFTSPEPMYLILYVDNLQLARLLSLITGDKASGTGEIEGAMPVIFAPDGGFMPGSGHFSAQTAGTISLSPDAIPGDNPQIKMAREALSNFHYTKLTITSETDKNGKLSMTLNIEGSNPDAFNGQSVKLNVNLTGDVLELLQQTLIPSTNPTQFLERRQ